MLDPDVPALILAPMDGVTDAPMRAVQGETGTFTFAVSEFLRVSQTVPPQKVFYRHIPELLTGGRTPGGIPVQVQLLGGDAGRMAEAALVAWQAGATAIDINFGCPAPTVNRHDGGATLLKHPKRIREIVAAVREAVPVTIPVSAKLRLGWDTTDAIFENAVMAAEGGASWLTIHGRTRTQGYAPPIYWPVIGLVREHLAIPVVANGDIWTIEGFRRCREETGCRHFMLGRGALANPRLPYQAAHELGLRTDEFDRESDAPFDWLPLFSRLIAFTQFYQEKVPPQTILRMKQWLKMAAKYGNFCDFEVAKRAETMEELFLLLKR